MRLLDQDYSMELDGTLRDGQRTGCGLGMVTDVKGL